LAEGPGEEKEEPMPSKWDLGQLKAEYEKMGINYESVFKDIQDVLIKTLIAVEPHISANMRQVKNKQTCFEVYGFDILLDQKLKPWLLEVNVCPSLSSSSPLDKMIKTKLLCDSLHLTGFHIFDRKKLEKEQEKIDKQRLLGYGKQSVDQDLVKSPVKSIHHEPVFMANQVPVDLKNLQVLTS
jgi:tubulin polyglutamylase TTLL4